MLLVGEVIDFFDSFLRATVAWDMDFCELDVWAAAIASCTPIKGMIIWYDVGIMIALPLLPKGDAIGDPIGPAIILKDLP